MLKEMANMLNGHKYGTAIEEQHIRMARESGIIIVYGEADDLCIFNGAWYDEAHCFDGGDIYISPDGLFRKPDNCDCGDDECPLLRRELARRALIKAVWCDEIDGKVVSWSYQTKILHETFMIYYDDGESYCRGIVFYAKDAVR